MTNNHISTGSALRRFLNAVSTLDIFASSGNQIYDRRRVEANARPNPTTVVQPCNCGFEITLQHIAQVRSVMTRIKTFLRKYWYLVAGAVVAVDAAGAARRNPAPHQPLAREARRKPAHAHQPQHQAESQQGTDAVRSVQAQTATARSGHQDHPCRARRSLRIFGCDWTHQRRALVEELAALRDRGTKR